MKIQMKNILGVALACAGLMMNTSCTDFEEINKNPYYPDKDMEKMDGVLNSEVSSGQFRLQSPRFQENV